MNFKSLSKRIERLTERMESAELPQFLIAVRNGDESDEKAIGRALAPYSTKDHPRIPVVCLNPKDLKA